MRHRTALKARIHQTLIAFGVPCPVSGLFGHRGRLLLERLALPEPWLGDLQASLRLIDDLDRQIALCESGSVDRRGPLAKNGPRYLRWALIEADQHAGRSAHDRRVSERTRHRLGRNRGAKVAAIEVARRLCEAGATSPPLAG